MIFARILTNFPKNWAQVFSNQTMLGAIFAHTFTEFVKVFRDFALLLKDFARNSTKSKLLGVCLHPRLPHQ